jgi:copper binding plastocyanin/azurin family protein
MASPRPEAARPWNVILPVIVVATAGSIVVGYLGLAGILGGTIPGERLPAATACEGKDRLGFFHFIFVAGIGGGYTFNGTTPGPCVEVVVNSHINVTFEVSSQSSANHSWVLIPAGAPSNAPAAFPGAGFNSTAAPLGIAPGTQTSFSFQVTRAGAFQYICEVPGHRDLGMYGSFTVTATPG